jgi:hypothetical protein
VEALEQSDRLPADLAFLAMAHFRLGQTEKALDYLNRLRETMKRPWADNEEEQGFLGEATALVQVRTDKAMK